MKKSLKLLPLSLKQIICLFVQPKNRLAKYRKLTPSIIFYQIFIKTWIYERRLYIKVKKMRFEINSEMYY